jgi:hypothetical protein
MFTIVALSALALAGPASAKGYHYHAPKARTYHYAAPKLYSSPTYVHGYTRKNGTYVMPHYQTAPNATRLDNWSTKGNVNPYTGKAGTKDPYAPPSSDG